MSNTTPSAVDVQTTLSQQHRANTTNPWGITRRQGRTPYSACNGQKSNTELPGGRKLWCQLVMGVTLFAVVGAVFVVIGSIFYSHATRFSDQTSLPAIFCIISIILGITMMILSIVMGKLFISDKWRKNQQPVYSSQQQNVRTRMNNSEQRETMRTHPPSSGQSPDMFTVRSAAEPLPTPPQVQLQPPAYSLLPPSYEESTKFSMMEKQTPQTDRICYQ